MYIIKVKKVYLLNYLYSVIYIHVRQAKSQSYMYVDYELQSSFINN